MVADSPLLFKFSGFLTPCTQSFGVILFQEIILPSPDLGAWAFLLSQVRRRNLEARHQVAPTEKPQDVSRWRESHTDETGQGWDEQGGRAREQRKPFKGRKRACANPCSATVSRVTCNKFGCSADLVRNSMLGPRRNAAPGMCQPGMCQYSAQVFCARRYLGHREDDLRQLNLGDQRVQVSLIYPEIKVLHKRTCL